MKYINKIFELRVLITSQPIGVVPNRRTPLPPPPTPTWDTNVDNNGCQASLSASQQKLGGNCKGDNLLLKQRGKVSSIGWSECITICLYKRIFACYAILLSFYFLFYISSLDYEHLEGGALSAAFSNLNLLRAWHDLPLLFYPSFAALIVN